MDGQDEVINNHNNNNNNNNDNIGGQSIVKGKRTKRQRPQSPIPFRMITNSTTNVTTTNSYKSDEGSDICSNNNNNNNNIVVDNVTTTTIASDEDDVFYRGGGTTTPTTEEEEDMANCLILLAQGHARDLPPQPLPLFSLAKEGSGVNNNNNNNNNNKFVSRKFMETPSTTGKSGYYVYECKTCSKTFSSFQALGGHRASHKKPKNRDEDYINTNKSRSNNIFSSIIPTTKNNYNNNNHHGLHSSDDDDPPFKIARHIDNNNNISSSTSLSLQLTNRALYNGITNHQSSNKGRVHECSICGAEFTSGQALGGHMRRHRGPVNAATTPIIAAVPLAIQQAPAADEMSEDMMITSMRMAHLKSNTNSLSLDLDLNLPAPAEENNVGDHQRESKYVFETKQPSNDQQQPSSSPPPPPPPPPPPQQQQLVFSSPALVDCHY